MFGTKVVTATYYRAHCENSLYYSIQAVNTACTVVYNKLLYKPMSNALSRKI